MKTYIFQKKIYISSIMFLSINTPWCIYSAQHTGLVSKAMSIYAKSAQTKTIPEKHSSLFYGLSTLCICNDTATHHYTYTITLDDREKIVSNMPLVGTTRIDLTGNAYATAHKITLDITNAEGKSVGHIFLNQDIVLATLKILQTRQSKDCTTLRLSLEKLIASSLKK